MSVIVKALTVLEMQRIFALIYFLFAYQQWIRTHRRGQWVLTQGRRVSHLIGASNLLFLQEIAHHPHVIHFALAVAIDMHMEDDVDALTKNADLGCSAATTNCSITPQSTVDDEHEVVKHKADEESGRVGSGEGSNEGEEDAEEFFTVKALPHQWGNEEVLVRLYIFPFPDVWQSAESSTTLFSVDTKE
ncbi:unnamed protein product [Taenia asiatica]|uniref:Uncharacterized protein n=1 Tax=Taenia asiatica TaxID=60517 RepID=A0A0R3WEV5_TAEAS|nr:unnamed protein product [Taenia asiatica]